MATTRLGPAGYGIQPAGSFAGRTPSFVGLADIRRALRAFLLQDGDIAAAVGAARVHPTDLPQGVGATSIVYRRLGRVGDHHMEAPSGLVLMRVELACWAPDFDVATALARLVKERLDGYAGPMTTVDPPATVSVQGAFFDTSRHDYASETKLYGARAEYLLWYEAR